MLSFHVQILPLAVVRGLPQLHVTRLEPPTGPWRAPLQRATSWGGRGMALEPGLALAHHLHPAAALLVLDERENLSEREGLSTLTTGQEVTASCPHLRRPLLQQQRPGQGLRGADGAQLGHICRRMEEEIALKAVRLGKIDRRQTGDWRR